MIGPAAGGSLLSALGWRSSNALGRFAAGLFKSRCRFEAENLLLRHQLSIALRRKPLRLRLRRSDRPLLVCMTRFWPSLLDAVQVVELETVVCTENPSALLSSLP